MLAVFGAMLADFGGSFHQFSDNSPEKIHTGGRKASSSTARPLSMDHYYVTRGGYLRRNLPKRDKSMTARQWRKFRRQIGNEAALKHLRSIAVR